MNNFDRSSHYGLFFSNDHDTVPNAKKSEHDQKEDKTKNNSTTASVVASLKKETCQVASPSLVPFKKAIGGGKGSKKKSDKVGQAFVEVLGIGQPHDRHLMKFNKINKEALHFGATAKVKERQMLRIIKNRKGRNVIHSFVKLFR